MNPLFSHNFLALAFEASLLLPIVDIHLPNHFVTCLVFQLSTIMQLMLGNILVAGLSLWSAAAEYVYPCGAFFQ